MIGITLQRNTGNTESDRLSVFQHSALPSHRLAGSPRTAQRSKAVAVLALAGLCSFYPPIGNARADSQELASEPVVACSGIELIRSLLPTPVKIADNVYKDLPKLLVPIKLVPAKPCAVADVACLLAALPAKTQGFALLIAIERTGNTTYIVKLTLIKKGSDSDVLKDFFSVSQGDLVGTATYDSVIANRIREKTAAMWQKATRAQPAEEVAIVKPPPHEGSTPINVETRGCGVVTSEGTVGIDCGTRCNERTHLSEVTLLAKPCLGQRVLELSPTSCRSPAAPVHATLWPCVLDAKPDKPINLSVRFGHSVKRKALAGVFGVLTGATLVSSLTLLLLQNQPVGNQATDGTPDPMRYNSGRYGLLGLLATAGFGVGLVLPLTIPDQRGN